MLCINIVVLYGCTIALPKSDRTRCYFDGGIVRSIAGVGGCWVFGGAIDGVARGIRAGIRAIAIGTATFSIHHLMLESSDFFTGFTFLANLVLFCGSRFKIFI
ncbi:hypothetical protein [Microcoleus sp. EPA2]|uniref:hypothetical protein n=1 Tax=Microcoleus sp. EPA2 TaxID=2841654 RepID=UPI00312B5267